MGEGLQRPSSILGGILPGFETVEDYFSVPQVAWKREENPTDMTNRIKYDRRVIVDELFLIKIFSVRVANLKKKKKNSFISKKEF